MSLCMGLFLAAAFRRSPRWRRRRTIRPAPSRWWCPIRRAAASTPWRASWRRELSAALGQQVVVDNRGGGGGTRSARARWSKAAPDGYTLLLGHTGTISINPSLYANAGYDPRKDFSADRTDRLDAGRADRASVVSGARHRRRDRARQEGARQATISAPRRSAPVATLSADFQVGGRHRCAIFPTRARRA